MPPPSSTATTIAEIAEPTQGLFDGRFMGAWNSGNYDEFFFFGEDASFLDMGIGSEDLAAAVAFLDSIAWRHVYEDCTWIGAECATDAILLVRSQTEPISTDTTQYQRVGLQLGCIVAHDAK